MIWKKVQKGVLAALVVYGALTVVLYMMQRDMMYFPDRQKPDIFRSGVPGMVEMTVRTEDGLAVTGWYKPPAGPGKPVILWFHGNAQNHAYRVYSVLPYLAQGYGVLLAGYRGYGGNPGTPTEQGLYSDGRAYIGALREKGVPIVVYGESLGTGVAVQVALENSDVSALVLEAPYSSTVEIAQAKYPIFPVALLMKDRFESIEKIADVRVPILIVHGQKDAVIPYRYGKRLFDAARDPKSMKTFPQAGHSDLYRYGAGEEILAFIRSLLQAL